MTNMDPLPNSLDLIRTRLLKILLEMLLAVLQGSATLVLLLAVHRAICSPSSSVVLLGDVLILLVSPSRPEALISRLVSMSLLWMPARVPSVPRISIQSQLAQPVAVPASNGVLSVQRVVHVMVLGPALLL